MKKIIYAFFCLFFVSSTYASSQYLEDTLQMINDGKTDQAIETIKKNLEENKSAENYVLMGIAYLEKNDAKNAEENFKKALLLDKKTVSAHYMLAMLYEKEKKYEQSIEKWKKICKYTKNEKLKNLAVKHLEQLKGITK
jgi:Tfp pilus assembly protein PilF